MKNSIKVRAKLTAGTHPLHGPIVKGQIYTITPEQMAPQLFALVKETKTPPADTGPKP